MTETGDITQTSTEPVTDAVTTEPDSGEGEGDCVAVGAWRGQLAMDAWCELNCHHDQPYCPPDLCSCQAAGAGGAGNAGGDSRTASSQCAGVGAWAESSAVATWCNNNCLRPTSFCPASMCQCW